MYQKGKMGHLKIIRNCVLPHCAVLHRCPNSPRSPRCCDSVAYSRRRFSDIAAPDEKFTVVIALIVL